jgi:lysophospholipase L1-like esterase
LPAECSVPDDLMAFAASAEDLTRSLREGEPVEIVALGSSSTQGAGAGGPDLTYPSLLQAELAKRFPHQEIHVTNRGIGGELAYQMLERLPRDVLPRKPDLVVWQTGTNDALSRIELAEFSRTLRQGINRLERAGIDVMLMDLQYYPMARNLERYERYVAEMARVAAEEDVGLFPRFAFMRYWNDHEPSPPTLWSQDHFHMGRFGYRCVAATLAEAIERAVNNARADRSNAADAIYELAGASR